MHRLLLLGLLLTGALPPRAEAWWFRRDTRRTELRQDAVKAEALYQLGLDELKRGLTSEAERILRRAEELKHTEAAYTLGYLYYTGEQGFRQDPEAAVALLKKAAEAGHPQARIGLFNAFVQGSGTPVDLAQAVQWLRQTAETDEAEAAWLMGLAALRGIGTEPDEKAAWRWFRAATRQEHPEAMYMLGICFIEGIGCRRDPQQALQWLRKAGEQGHADAQYHTSQLLLQHNTAEANREALDRLRQAAGAGHPEAMFALVELLARGALGIAQNHAESVDWLEKAVEAGHPPALELLRSIPHPAGATRSPDSPATP